jgi:hypothetical protein
MAQRACRRALTVRTCCAHVGVHLQSHAARRGGHGGLFSAVALAAYIDVVRESCARAMRAPQWPPSGLWGRPMVRARARNRHWPAWLAQCDGVRVREHSESSCGRSLVAVVALWRSAESCDVRARASECAAGMVRRDASLTTRAHGQCMKPEMQTCSSKRGQKQGSDGARG